MTTIQSTTFHFSDFPEMIEINERERLALTIPHDAKKDSRTNFTQMTTTDFLKTVGITSAISVLDVKLTPSIAKIATEKLGLCLSHFLPDMGRRILSTFVNPLARLNQRIGSLFSKSRQGQIFIISACEEVEFRWLIQDVILKKLPKKILEHVAPEHLDKLNSNLAKISRVAATSLLFANCHLSSLECSQGGGIPQLVGGLLYGLIYEYTELSLIGCINLHCIYNFFNPV